MNNIKKKNNRFSKPGLRKNKQQSTKPKGRPVSSIDPNSLIKKASVTEEKPFVAKYGFEELDLDKRLKSNIAKKGYQHPTEIQEASMEQLIEGRNMVGVANTGTGKTGAFLIPIVEKLLTSNKPFKTLVVVPTRELAQQVEAEFKSLTLGLGMSVSCFIGGTNVNRDVGKAKRRNHLIVGTPGRLMDLHSRGVMRFQDISVFVLDEFDRMLDMGFVHEIKKMAAMMTNRKQTMLFSATVDQSQAALIGKLVTNPVRISVSSGKKASNTVEQDIIRVGEDDNKFDLLMDLLQDDSFEKVILFAETKRMVDRVAKKLNKAGITAGQIHGDKSQNFRTRAISQFKKGDTQVLVATDVAARGIDIDEVTHVINYQLPMTMDSYIHRIGRTGRAGNKGMAYTFVEKAKS